MASRESTPSGTSGLKAPSQNGDDSIKEVLADIKTKLLVMSGKGGVGKSSVSAGLAMYLAERGYQVGLLDVDIHGPSLAGMMGVQGLLDIDENQRVLPKAVNANLKIVSMQSLMQNKDQAVIWRGPAKSGVIRQFVGDVRWGKLDFLIVDAPPGTGDEPMSVAQYIPDAQAIIVTTPQDVALADVRKSINFCRTIQMKIMGLVENMGPFSCPCCGKTISLFKEGGGQRTASQMDVPFMGTLPFDPQVVKAFDGGTPFELKLAAADFIDALAQIVEKVEAFAKNMWGGQSSVQ